MIYHDRCALAKDFDSVIKVDDTITYALAKFKHLFQNVHRLYRKVRSVTNISKLPFTVRNFMSHITD